MRMLFVVMLVMNFLLEALAAVTLISGPGGISAAGTGEQWSMHYGFAALAIASISLWIWPRRNDAGAVATVLGVLLVFHAGLMVSLAVAGDQMFGLVMHTIVAAMCLVLVLQRGKVTAPA